MHAWLFQHSGITQVGCVSRLVRARLPGRWPPADGDASESMIDEGEIDGWMQEGIDRRIYDRVGRRRSRESY